MSEKYLYISEGGENVFMVEGSPTQMDIDSVGDGLLAIIRLSDMKEMEDRDKWVPLKRGTIHDYGNGDFYWSD
jgi:hypothetical protein